MPLREMWVTAEEEQASRDQQRGRHANRLELFLAQERDKLSIFALQVFRGAAPALESWNERDNLIPDDIMEHRV